MVYLLPTLGFLFLFLGIIIFVIVFLFDSPNQSHNLFLDHGLLSNSNLMGSFQGSTSQFNNSNPQESNNENQANQTSSYIKQRTQYEKDNNRKLSSISIALVAALFFTLFLYLIAGGVILWYFRDSWHLFTLTKVFFMIFYILGLVLLGLAIAMGFKAYRLGDIFSPVYLHSVFSGFIENDLNQNDKSLFEELKNLFLINQEKRRALNWAKYLFIFIFFSIIIQAIILIFHYQA